VYKGWALQLFENFWTQRESLTPCHHTALS
jgi:hypothetical protein